MKRDTRKFVRRMKLHRLASAATPISAATMSPARIPGVVAAFATSRIAPTSRIVRYASPNSNLRLKSMLLHSPVERSAREAQLRRRQRHVEMVHAKRALDHLLFELVKVERFAGDRQRSRGAGRQREILDAVCLPLRHDHRSFGRVPERANIAWPIMPRERFQHSRRDQTLWLVVLAGVELEVMIEQNRHVLAPLAQRRKRNLDGVQAEQQVLAKAL